MKQDLMIDGSCSPYMSGNFITDWQDYRSVASDLIKTGFLPKGVDTPEKVIAILMTAKELGIPPMQSIRSLYIVDQKPAMTSSLMLALIMRSGKLEDYDIKENGSYCEVTMKRKGIDTPFTAKFGEDEAKKANLIWKDNYKKYPMPMYRSRAISICARVLFSDVIGGLYTPEEIKYNLDDENIVDVVADTEEKTNTENYPIWKAEFLQQFEHDLDLLETSSDIYNWRKSHKKELNTLMAVDKERVEHQLNTKLQEVISEVKEEKPTLKQYLNQAEEQKTLADLKSWFKSVKSKAQKDLDKAQYNFLLAECLRLKEEFAEKPILPEKEIEITNQELLETLGVAGWTTIDVIFYAQQNIENFTDFESLSKQQLSDLIKHILDNPIQ